MADETHIEHVTIEGERWDQLAARYYGDPYGYEPILSANPGVAIVPILPAGLRLRIPIQDKPTTLAQDLPPWKR